MRTACHPRPRNVVYHWPRVATQTDDIAKARYAAHRARGKSMARPSDRSLTACSACYAPCCATRPTTAAHR